MNSHIYTYVWDTVDVDIIDEITYKPFKLIKFPIEEWIEPFNWLDPRYLTVDINRKLIKFE